MATSDTVTGVVLRRLKTDQGMIDAGQRATFSVPRAEKLAKDGLFRPDNEATKPKPQNKMAPDASGKGAAGKGAQSPTSKPSPDGSRTGAAGAPLSSRGVQVPANTTSKPPAGKPGRKPAG